MASGEGVVRSLDVVPVVEGRAERLIGAFLGRPRAGVGPELASESSPGAGLLHAEMAQFRRHVALIRERRWS